MSPTIVKKDGKVVLVTGSPGGSTIPTTVLQVILGVIDEGKDIATAVNSSRIHYQGQPNIVISEPFALSSQEFQQLWDKGYKVVPFFFWGAAESIQRDRAGKIWEGRDRRKS
jgi:gamma-glutamyltranspeptidase/glutathione hydrolase